jgi:aryl-alcohol dehydrogenase-like predicted oxidoreductase
MAKRHCIHPAFLEDQLNRSLKNIGIETLDVAYLQNAAENQLHSLGYEKFYQRIAEAFEFYEKMVQQGKIKAYGLTTWNCFRLKPEPANDNHYLSLQKIHEIAEKVGGKQHNFKYVQVPVNILMPETFAEKWQILESEGGSMLLLFSV